MELFKEKKDHEAYIKIIHGEIVPMSKARITRLIVSLHRASLYLNKYECKAVVQLYKQYQHDNEFSNMSLIPCIDICESILQDFNRVTRNEEYANPNALVFAVELNRVFSGQYSIPDKDFDIGLDAPNFEIAVQHQLQKNPALYREDVISFLKLQTYRNTIYYSHIGELCHFDHFINSIASRDPKHAYLVLDYFINEAFPYGEENKEVMSIMYKQKIKKLL